MFYIIFHRNHLVSSKEELKMSTYYSHPVGLILSDNGFPIYCKVPWFLHYKVHPGSNNMKFLQECFKQSFENGKLASSQYQAVIVLIEKRGNDKKYIRPISLLNVDTKILSKVLASRLKKSYCTAYFSWSYNLCSKEKHFWINKAG